MAYRANVAQLEAGRAVAPDVAAGAPLNLEDVFNAQLEEVSRLFNHQSNPSVATRELLAQAAIRKAAIVLQHLTTLYPQIMVPLDVMDAIQRLEDRIDFGFFDVMRHLEERVHDEVQQSEQRVRNEMQQSEQRVHNEMQCIHTDMQRIHTDMQQLEQRVHTDMQHLEQRVHTDMQQLEQRVHTDMQQLEQRVHTDMHQLVREQRRTTAHLFNIRAAAYNTYVFSAFENLRQPLHLRPFVKTNEGLGHALPRAQGQDGHLPVIPVGDPVPAPFFPLTPAVLSSWTHDQISTFSMLVNEDFGIEREDDVDVCRHKVRLYLVSS